MPTLAQLLPPGVTLTGDRAVYLIASASRPQTHRCDVEMMVCECESWNKGKSYRERKASGMLWRNLCPHMRRALSAHGVVMALAQAKLAKESNG